MSGAKTVFFMLLMMGLMLLVGSAFDAYFGGRGMFMTIFLFISIIMNFVTYWFADTIVLKLHGAREVTREEAPGLHAMVERLTQRAGLPMPRVCVMPTNVPNAFATGRNPSHAAVAVTTGLTQILNEHELEGVIAHELAHIKHYDTLLQTVVASMAGVIAFMGTQARWFGLFMGGGDRDREHPLGGLIGLLFLAILAPIFALVVKALISQQREYAADRRGAEISGDPSGLASALRNIERRANAIQDPRFGMTATEHLYFINHFHLGGMGRLFSSHPPTEERIRRLLDLVGRV